MENQPEEEKTVEELENEAEEFKQKVFLYKLRTNISNP